MADRGKEKDAESNEAREEMERFQEQDELPSDLKEWPDGKAKYMTFDNDSGEAYGEGLTEKLGPAVVHHDDGSVSIKGEKVDNPEDYKGEPITLAATDRGHDSSPDEDDKES